MKCPNCGANLFGPRCEFCGEDVSFMYTETPEVAADKNIPEDDAPYRELHISQPKDAVCDNSFQEMSGKSKSVATLLCGIGLFGFAGLHRFYTGKYISGILYLLTYGFLWIGTIADLISLSNGTFTDSEGNMLSS